MLKMNNKSLFFLAFACLFASVFSQVTFNVQSPVVVARPFTVGVEFSSFAIGDANTIVTVTPAAVSGVTITPSSLSFNTTSEANTEKFFTVTATIADVLDTITVTYTSASSAVYTPSTFSFTPVKRIVSVNFGSSTSYVGVPSSAAAVTIPSFVDPDTGSVTVTFLADPPVATFTPPSVTINARSSSSSAQQANFYYTISNYIGSVTVYSTLSNNANFVISNSTITSLIRPAPIIPSFTPTTTTRTSNNVVAQLAYAPVTSVSYRPTAANTTFTPSVLTFTPSVTSISFSFVSSYPGTYPITFTTEGPDAAIYNNYTTARSAVAQLAPAYLSTPNTNRFLMTQASANFIYTLSTPAVNGLTVTPHVAEGSTTYVTVTPSTLTFAAGETTKTFTLTSSFPVTATAISFTLSGPDAAFFTTPSVSTNFPYIWKKVSVTTDAGTSDGYCGDAKTFTIRTDFPTVSGFSVAISPSSANTAPVVINPASINFVAGDTQHTFTVTGSGSPRISFSVTGQDVSNLDLTNLPANQIVTFDNKIVSISAASPSTAYPGTTVQYAVTVDQLPATTLTVTPSASGVTFTPASVTFTPTTGKTIYVSAVAQSAATFSGTWSLSGTDSECFFLNNAAISLVVSTITTTSTYGNDAQYRKAYPITIRVPNLSADLTATVSAADTQGTPYAAVFSQSTLTFSRAVSTVTFTVTFPVYSANQIVISFALTGAPASYVTIFPISVTVDPIEVKVPTFGNTANDESFYYNTVSPTFSVPLVVPTTNGLTVRLHSNQMTITPSALTYAAGASVATFSFSNRVAGVTTDTITYTLEGADADLYSLSAASTIVKFSAIPIYNNLDDAYLSLTVGKPFTFVLSTPVAPSNVLTLLPQGPFTFSPATIALSPTATSISVTATPTSAMDDVLSFVLSGPDAPFYDTPNDLYTVINRASISVQPPSDNTISTGLSSKPYTLTANIIPTNGVTITPYSPLVTFTPASITLDATHPSRTFTFTVNPNTITATSATTVIVSYILSGVDAVNFDQMSDSSFSVGTYNYNYFINFPAAGSGISLTYGQTTTFSVTASGVANSVTVTPTAQNGNFVFFPATATLTPGSLTAIFSVTASGYYVDSQSYLELVLGGTDAPLFNQPSNAVISATKAIVTHNAISNVVIGTSSLGSFTLNYQPVRDLTITLSTAQAGVTITPNQFTITPSSTTTYTYTVTSSIAQTVTIVFATSGNSAGDFDAINTLDVVFSTGTINTNTGATSVWQAPGHTRTIRLSLNTPVVSGLTVTPVASKLTFSPATITFAAGSTYAEVNATATGTAAVSAFTINYVLGGVDAPRFGAGSPIAYSVNQLKIVSTALDALYADQSFTASLQTSASSVPNFDFAPITIEPVAPGFTFTPASAVFSPQQISVTFIATATNILPATTLVYKVSNTAALQASTLTFGLSAPAVITPNFALVGTSSGSNVAIGGTVQALFSLLGNTNSNSNNGRSTLLSVVPETTVTFSSNVEGEFTPSTVTLANGVFTAPVSFKPTQLYAATVYIYYSISGAGSSFFTTEGSVSFATVAKRSLVVAAPYQLTTLTGSITTYGQETDKFYVSGVSTADFQATLTPISDYFDFNPTSINFANASSTAFSAIPKKLGRNLAIQFSISGPDAGLFNVPAALGTYSVIPLVNVSYIPALVANKKSDPIYVSLTPAPLETIIVTPSCSGAGVCIFDPPSMTFSPANRVGSFKVTSRSANMFNPSASNIVVPGGASTVSTNFAGGSLTFTASDSVSAYNLPINAYGTSTSLTVAQSTFSISHPRYQHRVSSHVTISVSELPRSDVAVTLYGTNVEFEPAYVIFTAGGLTKQKIKVTPKHSSSYELDHAPIKIEYGCSGTDRANYICPTESQHYVAIQRGYIAAAVLLSILAVVLLALAIFFFAIRPRRAATYSGGSSKGKNIEIKE